MRGRKPCIGIWLLILCMLASPLPAADGAGELDRGVALVRSGEYKAASEVLRRILEADPGNREAQLWLARSLSFSGDFAAGEREYREVLSADPGNVEARFGLADVLAWQKRYREATLVLSDLAKDRPGDPEVWVRKGKVALWGGNPEEAKGHFDKALELDPDNGEARRGLGLIAAKAAREYLREADAGAAYLRIQGSTPGSQVYAAIRDRSLPGWEFLGRADYLHRFKRNEGRGTIGVTRKWDGGRSLRIEGGFSPDAEVFSRASGEAELAWPLSDRLVGYAGGKYQHFSTADVWDAAGALEWYIRGQNALFGRYVFTLSDFDTGESSNDGTWTVRLTHFFTDDDRVWVSFTRGSESYTTRTVDQIGNVSSDTIVLGGRTFPFPRWGFEGLVAWQDREGGNNYFSVAARVTRRF